ncbi:THUMP-like domain-containing protein [Dyadobacter sp. BHUBP1]|uniref:THUMP-like domain-containing protein n=1 Tax=Dyadobacter sp. BHUBP1 TaxID=3424178 RepID=UPI003D353FE4
MSNWQEMAAESSAHNGLTEAEIAFIREHLYDNPGELILKAGKFRGLDVKKLAGQIQSRQKALKKLPEWSANENLIFPPALSVEQCSSEATAHYKAGIVSGKTLIDITGGMGIDCYYMSRSFAQTHYFEQQLQVASTAEYNFTQLGATRIHVHAGESLTALRNGLTADWLYADPARRDANKEKVVRLADCTPDVAGNAAVLLNAAPNILIKTSPLLDIDLASKELQKLKEVHVMGYEQECKELLFILDREMREPDFKIKVRIIDAAGQPIHELDFDREEERNALVDYSRPLGYLYEPHAAVLKAGAFKTLCARFNVRKLAMHSQLYTSEDYSAPFPGRCFRIVAVCKPDIREILQHIPGDKANITTRNFPAKPEELRKKWKIKDGGDHYLFATTLADQSKVVIVCVKPI